ncbi:hypothetical protein BBK14_05300 [Parafrankia soli]|uniref:Uncharacterized protein n=1 Tax=Parafrankia soli TaxID=2599596 RepID=A0A1S1Q141_9ACTN|nr:hypothetical protein [Parafrankia sp. Ea1.12]OHV27279.1 hypothetical protein BBK14_05300 [Parafrankia soli]
MEVPAPAPRVASVGFLPSPAGLAASASRAGCRPAGGRDVSSGSESPPRGAGAARSVPPPVPAEDEPGTVAEALSSLGSAVPPTPRRVV